ncbi:MAG: trypsin-like peptidase domain-containing protein [Candidatus Paceibacterota bacterium]
MIIPYEFPKEEVSPTILETTHQKSSISTNEIIYFIVFLFLILTSYFIFRFLKSKGIKIKYLKYKWFIPILFLSMVVIGGASYFGFKYYQNYQAEKRMFPVVLRVQKLIREDKNDEVNKLVKNFTEEDIKIFKEVLNKEKINLVDEIEKINKEKKDKETQKLKNLEVENLRQEVEILKNKPQKIITSTQANSSLLASDLAKYIVRIICSDGSSENFVVGSGTIFGLNKFILTNLHVVKDSVLCSVGVTDDIKKSPVRWYDTSVASTVPTLDIALLKPIQTLPDSVSTVAHNLCRSSSIKLGDEIIILGYPGVGGDTITATEGVISGFEGYMIKTSAKIEHGNSGGGAFLKKNGCWFGIPTSVTVGELESLGSIINYSAIHEQ